MNAGELPSSGGWDSLEQMWREMSKDFEAQICRERREAGTAGIFVAGEPRRFTDAELIEKGRELIAAGYPPAAISYSPDTNAAITAVHWYDEQHAAFVEQQRPAVAGAQE